VHCCVWSRNLVNEEAMAHWGLLPQKQTNIDLKWLPLLHCIQVLGWISPHSLTVLQNVFVISSVHPLDTRAVSQIMLWLLPSIQFQIHYSPITILSETIQLEILQVPLHKIHTNKNFCAQKGNDRHWTICIVESEWLYLFERWNTSIRLRKILYHQWCR
jgi:hypothetical protein